jgi:hypothetical protein
MKKISFITFIIFILINVNIYSKKIINPIDDNAKKMIAEVEDLIINYKTERVHSYTTKARSIINKLKERAKNNKYFEAKVIGLTCLLEMANNNYDNVKTHISGIEKRNKNEEKLFIIKAELEEDKKSKEKILLKGLKKTDNSIFIKLYLANNYYLTGKFIKAVKYYDEIYPELSNAYKRAYMTMKELATRFSKDPPNNIEIIETLHKKEITIKEMLEIIYYESKLLSFVDVPKTQTIKKLYNILLEDEFFNPNQFEKISFNSILQRKEFAYFLQALLAKLENDPSLKTKYLSNFVIEDKKSPIPDVDIHSFYYNAVLVLVEREILELPDGEHFYPKQSVSGLKLFEIIRMLEDFY